jgi:NADH pyrophosphatase NudC (nudix superfamily)
VGRTRALLELRRGGAPVRYCPTCGCHVEPSKDARVGWMHACAHKSHPHAIPFVIDQARRDRLFAKREEEVATA